MNTVTIRQRGEITLPKEVREACHVAPGAIFSVVPIGDVILLIPGHSRVGEAAGGLRSKPLSEANTAQRPPSSYCSNPATLSIFYYLQRPALLPVGQYTIGNSS
jgi:AbrB family looped-hinge helix DNA binding protein